MAVSAELRVVCSHLVANLESLDFVTDFDDDATGFVTSDHGHGRVENAVMDVQVGAADSTGFDFLN